MCDEGHNFFGQVTASDDQKRSEIFWSVRSSDRSNSHGQNLSKIPLPPEKESEPPKQITPQVEKRKRKIRLKASQPRCFHFLVSNSSFTQRIPQQRTIGQQDKTKRTRGKKSRGGVMNLCANSLLEKSPRISGIRKLLPGTKFFSNDFRGGRKYFA